MRLARSIFYTVVITIFSLLYVFQQTEITKVGYRITKAQDVLEHCHDKYTFLKSRLSGIESPFYLEKSLLCRDSRFEMAKEYRLVKIDMAQQKTALGSRIVLAKKSGDSFLMRVARQALFADRHAEAKTVSPR